MIPVISEHSEQASFVAEVHYRYRNRADFIPELFFAVPNGMWVAGDGRRKAALIAKYKREGVKPGVADIHYLQPRGKHPYCVIEMKRQDKKTTRDGGLSPQQRQYITAARNAGAFVRVCYSAEEAAKVFDQYMDIEQLVSVFFNEPEEVHG
jgi:VRR-NUC domain-containing protein